MKVEVTQVLKDVKFFGNAVQGIRFICDNNSFYSTFPTITSWLNGNVVLELANTSTTNCAEVVKRLGEYGINAEIVGIDGRATGGVKFAAKAGDDIIAVLHMALSQREQKKQLQKAQHQLSGLNQNVDQLIEQAPSVRRGAFSSGVNALLNQVNTLKNIRKTNSKQR